MRMFTLGIMLGSVALAVLALLPNSAAFAAFPAVSAEHRQPFTAAKRNGSDGWFAASRSGARKAVPITRGQDLGLRFRPDERESTDGYVVTPQGGATNTPFQSDETTQFRPAPTKRKRTYEELQAETEASQSLTPPPLPYPMMPAPPMPPYQQYFPHW